MSVCSDDNDTKCSKLLRASLRGTSGTLYVAMPLDNQCCLVRDCECVDTKSKDRVSYCKLLESSLTLTNTENPRCHLRTRYGMDE